MMLNNQFSVNNSNNFTAQKMFFILTYLNFKLRMFIACLALCGGVVTAEDFLEFDNVAVPVGLNAFEPSIYVTNKEKILLSWMEGHNQKTSINAAIFSDGKWSEPSRIAVSSNIFVNWADFPSISALDDGTIVVHWLESSNKLVFSYDIKISLSEDGGATWSLPFVPHLDGTKSQHGFASILPMRDYFIVTWLDGRAYENAVIEKGAVAGAMQLRAAVFSKNGTVKSDFALDFVTCSCCQTSAVLSNNIAIIAYRDRGANEKRDIAIRRLKDGIWSEAISVNDDGWEIYGCPVNGPSIDAFDKSVFVAWFTAANENSKIKVAMSKNSGITFHKVHAIKAKNPIGHVDITMIDERTGILSWLEWENNKEILKICKISLKGCSETQIIVENSAVGSLNFPKISATSSNLYIAWTQPLSDGKRTIRMLTASLDN